MAAFERAVAEATPEALERAATLYRGDLLEGLGVTSPPFGEWLLTEREWLRELALEALARLLAHYRQRGRADEAVRAALRLLSLDPLQEPVHRTLMRLYVGQGRRGSALRQYQTCVEALQRELGVEPESETKRLYQEILRQRPSEGTGVEALMVPPRAPVADIPLIGRAVEIEQLRDLRTGLSQSTLDFLKVFKAATMAIGVLAERRPLLVVLDDLHWADEMSLRLLAFFGRRLEARRVLDNMEGPA